MSRHAHIIREWAGGEHLFRLGIGELVTLQEETDRGPMEVLARLRLGSWKVADIVSTIRCGLTGGKDVTGAEARDLVKRQVVPPIGEFVPLAVDILAAALMGVADERVGKRRAAETRPPDPAAE